MDISGLLMIILAIALVGLIVWAIITYVPMPEPFKGIIIVAAIIVMIFWLFSSVGGIKIH